MPYVIEYFSQGVLDEVESWPVGILADYARITELIVEFGPQLQMPHSRVIGAGLFELRPRGPEGVGRALYCWAEGQRVIVLHAFRKKTRTTAQHDLQVARRRLKAVRDG